MYTYLPKNKLATQKMPLIVVLHGCTQTAKEISAETGWNKLADSLNFMVVYPEQRQINNITKCFNFFIKFKAHKDKGEVASIRNMISYCFENYLIDSSKIFITGVSAGGGMSNAMLNAYPELFNAGALLAAPSTVFEKNSINAKNQPRIVIIQGENDKIVTPNNAERLLEQWATKHQIDTLNVEKQPNYLNNELLTLNRYFNNAHQEKIILLTVKETAHKILINPGSSLNEGGEMDMHTKDIDFHSTYWIADFFGLTIKFHTRP